MTKLCFDNENPLFQEIANEPVLARSNAFGEMTARKLIAEEHFSLKEPSTIVQIIEMSNNKNVLAMFSNPWNNIETVLGNYGFVKSKNFVNYITEHYNVASLVQLSDLK